MQCQGILLPWDLCRPTTPPAVPFVLESRFRFEFDDRTRCSADVGRAIPVWRVAQLPCAMFLLIWKEWGGTSFWTKRQESYRSHIGHIQGFERILVSPGSKPWLWLSQTALSWRASTQHCHPWMMLVADSACWCACRANVFVASFWHSWCSLSNVQGFDLCWKQFVSMRRSAPTIFGGICEGLETLSDVLGGCRCNSGPGYRLCKFDARIQGAFCCKNSRVAS